MNLQDAMYQKLHEASLKAAREQSPQGLQPMTTQQGEEILRHLRRVTPHPFPKLSLRPMTTSQGQSILERLNER